MTEERRTVRDLLEQGHLESLVQWFNTQIETIENSKLLLGEALCSEMWRQLGHRNPRAILLPFLIVRLPPDILQKLAHTHITLLLIFIGEVAEEVKGESKFLKVLGVNVVARLFLAPSNHNSNNEASGSRWAILKEQFDRLAKEKKEVITRLFPCIELDEECCLSQVLGFIYRQLGNKYQVYIEKQRTEYRELREHNWKVADYAREFPKSAYLTLNDLEAFEAQRGKFTTIDREPKRARPREVVLGDFDVHLNPQRTLKGETQVDYVVAVIDKVLQRNGFTQSTDAYHVDYDPAVLEPVCKLYDTGRLLSVISQQTLDAVRKIILPSVNRQLFQQKNLVVYSEDYQIPRILVVLALLNLERGCGSRDVYCGRFYGKAYVKRCLQIQFPLNKSL